MRTPSARCKFTTALYLMALMGWMTSAKVGSADVQVNALGEAKSIERTYDTEFNPANQRARSAETEDVRVTLKRREPCGRCPGSGRMIFEVMNKRTGTKTGFLLENETAQVDDIRIIGRSKTVVVGRVLPNTSIVNVVDQATGKLIDVFYGFSPTISKNNQIVVYVKVFPVHFVEGVSAEYLVYDFTRTPEENRGSKISLDNHTDVGLPIFPPGSTNRPGDNVAVEEPQRHTMASDGFFWSSDSKKIAFADRSNGKNSLVVVDISPGLKTPHAETTSISTPEVVDLDRCAEYKARPEYAFHVSNISYVQANIVKVELSSPNPACLKRDSLELQLP